MAIYVTGDKHGTLDITDLNVDKFPDQKLLTKADYVIVCGDFGLFWDNKKDEQYWRKWLADKPFTTLYVDGNHENFNMINSQPIKFWKGGKVHVSDEGFIHLMRGQVFNIDGVEFFTMGGATSIDKEDRRENISWWPEELPNYAEYEEGLMRLELCNWQVDYVLTHDAPTLQCAQMAKTLTDEGSQLRKYFDLIDSKLEYKKWFFGHHHKDIGLDYKHICLYRAVLKIT